MAIKDHKSLQDSRILLVEDDKSIRLTGSETLSSEGFKIMSNNIADRENREELKTIKAALDRLEGVNTVDIYAESESD